MQHDIATAPHGCRGSSSSGGGCSSSGRGGSSPVACELLPGAADIVTDLMDSTHDRTGFNAIGSSARSRDNSCGSTDCTAEGPGSTSSTGHLPPTTLTQPPSSMDRQCLQLYQIDEHPQQQLLHCRQEQGDGLQQGQAQGDEWRRQSGQQQRRQQRPPGALPLLLVLLAVLLLLSPGQPPSQPQSLLPGLSRPAWSHLLRLGGPWGLLPMASAQLPPCPAFNTTLNVQSSCTNVAIDPSTCQVSSWCLNCDVVPITIFSFLNINNCQVSVLERYHLWERRGMVA